MSEKVIVTVKEGKVRGFKTKTAYSGVDYYTFLGVPYGKSTADSARYKDPIKVKPWTNILEANVEKEGCTQISQLKKELTGSEDCLYNNIHTPKIPTKGDPLKAVIVNFHPGGFFHGSPDPSYYGAPDYIMHRDVVYVCVAYRLHILGFLNLNMKVCSGNQAIKDAILSLQWIKENVTVFGGDPDNITLMGSSSGAMMVHLLLLSPLAKGLYHKATLMGMYAFNPVVVLLPENVSTAYDIATMLGYDGPPDDNKKLHKFFKNLHLARYLMTRPEYLFSKKTLQIYPVSPCCVNAVPGENSPIPVSLEKLIPTTNRVPIIIGFCEKEACMALALIRKFKISISQTFHKAIRQNHFGWGANLNDDELKLVQKQVENYYLAGEPIETASQPVLCDILTDAALSGVYDSLINVISADLPSSVYVYNFHYDGKLCVMKPKIERLLEQDLKGAHHSADNCYWHYFKRTAGSMSVIQSKDRQTIDTLTSLLTTFAKTSNPNYEGLGIEWKPTTPEHPSHLIIDETLRVEDELLNGERMEFWHKLKKKFKLDN